MIKSFIVKNKKGDLSSFRVKNETARFLECSSKDYGIIIFEKSKVTEGSKLNDLVRKWESADEVEIVEITTTQTAPATTGRGATYELLEAKAKIAQGDYVPNWDDNNPKYYPVFDMRNGGFAYSHTNCTSTYSCTVVGSRFCFPTSTAAENFGKDNLELYRILYKG
jgi:hypothetical protein